jgi:hypothetical protein
MAGQFVGMSYTARDEAEADKMGFAFYTHARWDPNKFGDFFQEMIDKGTTRVGVPERPPESQEPRGRGEEARHALPAQASQWRQPPIANDSEFKHLQARSVRGGQDDADRSVARAGAEAARRAAAQLPHARHPPDQQKASRRC